MKSTLILASIFLVGLLIGVSGLIPQELNLDDWKMGVVYLLLFFIGVGVSADHASFAQASRIKLSSLYLPALEVVGSLAGAGLIACFLPGMRLSDGMAVGAGFGYYSLSSILIAQVKGAELGAIALVANLARELFTVLFTPLLMRWFGPLAPIAAGGATTMDVCLPVIKKFCGNEYSFVAIINGVVLTMLVPILVPLFL